ncbi:cyclase superfamily [Cupriavidus necator N-1]|uniref:Cyclase superfamily n=1 Tax=Cupriavidus necator (strain ATCC 43291 / DSM 13513 / CCUG 52238 / LMG 8453 / N-1) TaxID=1042878 RepID=G0EX20_CUPNN|nr:cyclase family protein [Cupriavidus necator]AEI77193.1 cyclase superfamily [Cupriavidus necator N-1]MDX6014252.1 cyclase family protein [Cupriavidus necator]
MIVDLSHVFHDGMPGVLFKRETGEAVELTAHIRPFMTHAQSGWHYEGKASFEISEVAFQTSVGTKLDAPRHRFEGAEDIAALDLSRLVLDGVVIDARHATSGQQLAWNDLQFPEHLAGRAVLVNFDWDRHWGTEIYRSHPFVSRDVIDRLCDAGISLFGVDCANVDSTQDPERPAHTRLLGRGILIVENLTGLSRLHGVPFRFFSIPLKARDAAAFPVRAFAEVREHA